MKKRFIFIFVILIFFIDLILANPVSIKGDEKEYNIELVAVNRESALIKINNETKILRTVQQSPYTPEIFSSNLAGLKYVLTEMHYATYLGDVKYVNLLILIEKNLSTSGTKKVNMSYGGVDSNVEISSIDSVTQASIRLNYKSDIQATVQSSPYTIEKINQLSDLMYVLTSINNNTVTLLSGFEINLFLECFENWTCSNWSSCIDNQHARTCDDSNNCGTEKEIPSLIQDCTSETNITNSIPPCTNECEISAKMCFNESSFKSCLDNDNDNCTEWSIPVLCSDENKKMTCSRNGECIKIPKNNKNLTLWTIIGLIAVIVIGFVLVKFKIIKH
ncbi:hypothetical protein J4429_05395 [Candidatus Pacearchaeota archaeon]|nr:hypothetical protein [Candidatus Pacearchaeota archaeon]